MSAIEHNPELSSSGNFPELFLKTKSSSTSNHGYFNTHSASHSYKDGSQSPRKTPSLSSQQVFGLARNILKKSPQIRSPADNQIILQLTQHNKFLADLVQNISIDCFKGLMKQAKIQQVRQRQLLCEQGKAVTHMVVLLDGKLGICKQQEDFMQQAAQNSSINFNETNTDRDMNSSMTSSKNQSPHKTFSSRLSKKQQRQKEKQKQTRTIGTITPMDNVFDQLTAMSCKQIQNIRKKNVALKRKSSIPITAGLFLPLPFSQQQFQKYQMQSYVNPGQEYGAKVRVRSKFHTNTCIAVEKSVLLIIQMNLIVYWFEHAFRDKLGQTIQKLKKIPAFSFLQDGKIAECILFMRKQKKRRNDYIYKQGGKTDKLYILINGQVKLTKQAKLFQQNPNDLYVDRRKFFNKSTDLNSTKNNNQKNVQGLVYANFTTLYNYRPMKKNIEIGIITSNGLNGNFNLIGQSEMIQKRARQTDAMVTSFQCQYYEIQIKKLQQILGSKFIEEFYELMEKSLRKVILYRQNQYAQKINWQNKKNLDYFYYQNDKVKQSPRKYKLQKINNKFSQPKVKLGDIRSSSIPTKLDGDDSIKPFYTTFNFHKLIKTERLNNVRKQQTSEKKRPLKSNSKQANNQRRDSQDSKQSIKIKFDLVEQHLIGMSHTWKPIKKKVIQQLKVMQKISTKKHRININEPLIDQQYFQHVQKEQRRINREHKIFKLSLGKRTKW